MHTMWKGTISFGLVNIPVKMHAATENKDVKLRQLHKECESPIKYKKVCPVCDREVENDEIVKAYEYAKNKFVVLDDEELKALQKEQEDKAVEIMEDRKSTRLNSSHVSSSYAVFCLKKKNAIGTIAGACLGTSTVTTFVE